MVLAGFPSCWKPSTSHTRYSYDISAEHPEFTEPPSFYFHRQVYANCWYEHLTDYHMDGSDSTTFSSRPTFHIPRA